MSHTILNKILQEMQKMNRNDDDLWTRSDIAEYLRCSANQADASSGTKIFPPPSARPHPKTADIRAGWREK